MDRVIQRELPGADRETLLVVDATTGQNAVLQADAFNEACQLSGLILTKLDGTAKGGIAINLSARLGVPVKYIGVGEKAEDLLEFNAADFVKAFFE
jgi:fused signal recognition particle receptor